MLFAIKVLLYNFIIYKTQTISPERLLFPLRKKFNHCQESYKITNVRTCLQRMTRHC